MTETMKHRIFKSIVLSIFSWITVLSISGGWVQPSLAHWADLSVSEFMVEPSQVRVTLTVPTPLFGKADTDRDGQLSQTEVSSQFSQLQAFISDRLMLTDAAGAKGLFKLDPTVAVATLPNAENAKNDHTTLAGVYEWSMPRDGLVIRYTLFEPRVTSAQSLATITEGDRVQEYVFTPRQTVLTLQAGDAWGQISRFLGLGVEHIWSGYDHILFLLSVLMGSSGFASLLKIVTAFTVAHSITLSLAVLGIVQLPPIFVESAIALSIAYVAAENLIRKEPPKRWLLTFGFGLIHGLGFASILQEFNLSSNMLVLPLVSFNLGVELGQIAVVSVFYGLLSVVRKQSWGIIAGRTLSYTLIVVGLYWFFHRAILGTVLPG
jgi:hydrogenase/urease accessory protein HupE